MHNRRGSVWIGVLGTMAAMVFLVLIFFGYVLGAKRAEIQTRNATLAQVKVVEATHDKMWKVLSQKVGISNQYKPSNYKELLSEVVSGRQGGNLAKFVQEQNPQYDLSLLKDLGQSVEAERAIMLREQNRLVDLNREHENIIQDPLKSMFLSPSQLRSVEFTIITSSRSRNAAETGVDDDVDLFKN